MSKRRKFDNIRRYQHDVSEFQHRHKSRSGHRHFTFNHVTRSMQVAESAVSESNKRAKLHEAQMIPGIDGKRIFGFPNTIITKLRYATYITLTGATGARAVNVFAANGIFDPDITGTGHQPMWRDNYANLYDQYVVLGSKITVTFANTSTSVNALVGIVGDDDTSISSNVEALMEQNNGVSRLLGITGNGLETLTSTFEPLEMFGIDAKDDGSSSTANSANPTELWTYGVWVASADATSSITVNLKVEIDYTVKWTELITQGLS